MSRRILICLSHSIEEHDQLLLLHELGYEVASIGGYIDPAHPHDTKRPALPQVPCYPEVRDAVDALGTPDNFGAAQKRIPDAVLEWLGPSGVIIYHHYLDERLFPQWERLREWRESGGRIVWRTVGQSVENNERAAAPYRADGLEIVRYSPRERSIPGFSGEDALIRFWKDPDEWTGWTGEERIVVNVTQHMRRRAEWCNYEFWRRVTEGLAAVPLGPGSNEIGGPGELAYDEMRAWLRAARCHLYTGTQPASYTLGLIEAMMTGLPTVSIGPRRMTIFPYGRKLFEGLELTGLGGNDTAACSQILRDLLADRSLARSVGEQQRRLTIERFGKETVARAWHAFLGDPDRPAASETPFIKPQMEQHS